MASELSRSPPVVLCATAALLLVVLLRVTAPASQPTPAELHQVSYPHDKKGDDGGIMNGKKIFNGFVFVGPATSLPLPRP